MTNLVRTMLVDESGSTAIEYGLIAALVAVAIIAALTFVGTRLGTLFNQIGSNLSSSG
jgi:pilus assembly protein Flp/PilA